MLEFAGRFNRPDLVVKELAHWVVILRENVTTLGSCIFILKSGKAFLRDVSNEEMSELADVHKWFETKTKELYGAEKWNYCAMMMKDEFVHYHAIPRYSKTVNAYDREWIDEDWPKGTKLGKQDVENETLIKIIADLKD